MKSSHMLKSMLRLQEKYDSKGNGIKEVSNSGKDCS